MNIIIPGIQAPGIFDSGGCFLYNRDMKRIHIPIFILLMGFILWGSAGVVQADGPEFIPGDCPFSLIMGDPEATTYECGTVLVPENHDDPNGQMISLAVVVLHATSESPASDPLFMAQGGPGGSTIDTYADLILSKPEVLADRDIVLFDQRGTLYSSPSLICDELIELNIETIGKDLGAEEANQMYTDAMLACRDRLESDGVDLTAYNSFENAADIDWIRQALGYDQINYYGVSYGTLLGFHLLRTQPEWLRSAVLDAVVPPDINFIPEAARNQDHAFGLLFKTCQDNPDCNRAYPNLEEEFVKLVDELNENPLSVELTDSETFKKHQALVDGDTVISIFFQLLYSTDIIPALPRTVYDLKAGNADFFARIMEIVYFDRTMSDGMYYSVICAEDVDFSEDEQNHFLDGVRPWLANGQEDDLQGMTDICKEWPARDLNPGVDEPVSTDIPVLLLNGEFDPITPASNSEHAATTLSSVTNLTFPGMGHGAFLSNPCPTSIMMDFVKNPNAAVDTACIATMGEPEYLTPRNTIDFPVIMQALNMKPLGIVTLLAFCLCLAFLVLAWLAMPIAWLINRFRTRQVERDQPWYASLAIWLPPFLSLVLTGFLVGIGWVAYELVMANKTVIFFGLPMNTLPLFLIAIGAAVGLVLMTWVSIRAWIKGWWSVAMRVYYSLLAVAGVGNLIILAYWGALWPF